MSPVSSTEVLKLLIPHPENSSFNDFMSSSFYKCCPPVFELFALLFNLLFYENSLPWWPKYISVTACPKKEGQTLLVSIVCESCYL
jgi:hypothetical protein